MQHSYWLVMGVAGSGKTSVAQALALQFDGVFLDADDYHPQRNVERMRTGQPLSDDDRWPWLAAVAEAVLRTANREARPVFFACSALKLDYRSLLRQRLPGLQIIFLRGTPALIHQRMAQRREHYMPPDLLTSQLATLQVPSAEPGVVTIDVDGTLAQVVAAAIQRVASL
jgi:gluconokinase